MNDEMVSKTCGTKHEGTWSGRENFLVICSVLINITESCCNRNILHNHIITSSLVLCKA